jgi:hypothetical protein
MRVLSEQSTQKTRINLTIFHNKFPKFLISNPILIRLKIFNLFNKTTNFLLYFGLLFISLSIVRICYFFNIRICSIDIVLYLINHLSKTCITKTLCFTHLLFSLFYHYFLTYSLIGKHVACIP